MSKGRMSIFMVGPIPGKGNYIGGIGVFILQLIKNWGLPYSITHFNSAKSSRMFAVTGKLNIQNCISSVRNLFRLIHMVQKTRPTIVHYHTSRQLALLKDITIAACVKKFCRVKIIMHVHFSEIDSLLLTRNKVFRRFQLWALYRCCDHIILLSENIQSEFIGTLRPEAVHSFRARCTVMPNCIAVPEEGRESERSSDCVNLFFIGNLGPRKGTYDILTAGALLKDTLKGKYRITFAGPFDSLDEEKCIHTRVNELDIKNIVTFLGSVDGEQKRRAFCSADVFILPSYGEGIPISMLEAMAYGLPVVISNVGGIPEVVRDGKEGIIVKPGDINGLCCALKKLIESDITRQKMGKAARCRIVEAYTVDKYMHKLQDLYDSLLAPEVRS